MWYKNDGHKVIQRFSIFILFADYQATLLHQMLSAAGIFGNVQRMNQMTSQKIDELMSEKTATNDDTILNCTLLCSLNACKNYLAKVLY